jgi:hypothetical protein
MSFQADRQSNHHADGNPRIFALRMNLHRGNFPRSGISSQDQMKAVDA